MMSEKAQLRSIVFHAPVYTPNEKLVLLSLIERSNGYESISTNSDIVRVTHLSERTVRRVLGSLEKRGIIERDEYARPHGGRSVVWTLRHLHYALAEYCQERPETTPYEKINQAKAQTELVNKMGKNSTLKTVIESIQEHGWDSAYASTLAAGLQMFIPAKMKWINSSSLESVSLTDAHAVACSEAWAIIHHDWKDVLNSPTPWDTLSEKVREATGQVRTVQRRKADLKEDITTTPSITPINKDAFIGLDTIGALEPVIKSLMKIGVKESDAIAMTIRAGALAAQHRKSRQQTEARKDETLTALGLTPAAASSLVSLIAGSRTHGEQTSLLTCEIMTEEHERLLKKIKAGVLYLTPA
ncbi:helix-turn-helix transcriptional regulator [Boudabousia marimammalium]|uniref:Uncharacterized protein n=1 Tax=Boudabousia marimammalium TaxID=156892 RepID=A0A1Q5PMB0_9ACTO|nr:helix-turn-helix domain-containing protein [Boudabousia marimammalium]OKL48662.1 hypothetical protein BM477_05535 [Boudabousia marimammalium]